MWGSRCTGGGRWSGRVSPGVEREVLVVVTDVSLVSTPKDPGPSEFLSCLNEVLTVLMVSSGLESLSLSVVRDPHGVLAGSPLMSRRESLLW